jgi:hypothetical protein
MDDDSHAARYCLQHFFNEMMIATLWKGTNYFWIFVVFKKISFIHIVRRIYFNIELGPFYVLIFIPWQYHLDKVQYIVSLIRSTYYLNSVENQSLKSCLIRYLYSTEWISQLICLVKSVQSRNLPRTRFFLPAWVL